MPIKIDPATGAPIVVSDTNGGADFVVPESSSPSPENNESAGENVAPSVVSDDKQVVEPPSSEPLPSTAEDKKVEESPKEAPTVDFVPTSTKENLGKKLLSILEEYGGMESNIPINHEYWDVLNKHRSGH